MLTITSAFVSFIVFMMVADVALRGVALWRAARAKQKYWFIALLIVNSLGILPIVYLLTHKK